MDTSTSSSVSPPAPVRMSAKDIVSRVVAVVGIGWFIYSLCFTATAPSILRPVFVFFIGLLGVLLGPRPGKTKATRTIILIIDLLFLAAVAASTIFIIVDQEAWIMRTAYGHNTPDVVFSVITTIMVLELTRRTIGWPLVILAVVSMLYAYFGGYFPGTFRIFSYDWFTIFGQLYGTGDGLFGMMVGICSTYILPFVFLGAVMEMSGTGNYFIRLATFFTGRSRGGPGKVAVISSALFGTISGAGAANVVATGTFTIPLMKRTGYTPRFACAVESVASIGGQIMPPIMASAAFLAADLMGIPYGELIIYAVIPAILYYLSLYFTLDLEAGRLRMRPVPSSERESGRALLREFYLLLPLLIIIFDLCILGHSPLRAAVLALLGGFLITELNKETRLADIPFLKRVCEAAYAACKTLMPIGGAFVCASIVVAMLNLTGLGIKLSSLILSAAQDRLLIALVLTMVITVILGMGLPVAASYVIAASVCATSLVEMGVPLVAAHMFILHFASLSGITPPVALAAYTAAGIGEEKPLGVACTACRIGLCAFFVPYCFVFGPELLLLEGYGAALMALIPALCGCFAVVVGAIGWMTYPMIWPLRIACLIGGMCMMIVGTSTDIIGICLIIVSLVIHYLISRKKYGPRKLRYGRRGRGTDIGSRGASQPGLWAHRHPGQFPRGQREVPRA